MRPSNLCLHCHMTLFPVGLCVYFPFLDQGTSHWIRAHLNSVWSHLNIITSDPMSKQSHIHSYQGLDLNLSFYGTWFSLEHRQMHVWNIDVIQVALHSCGERLPFQLNKWCWKNWLFICVKKMTVCSPRGDTAFIRGKSHRAEVVTGTQISHWPHSQGSAQDSITAGFWLWN